MMHLNLSTTANVMLRSFATVILLTSANVVISASDPCPPPFCISTDPDNPCTPEPIATSCGVVSPSTGCEASNVRCVGYSEEYSTNITSIQDAFQDAVNDAKPGDTILIRGGTYKHNSSTSSATVFLDINVSGTSSAPITIKPYNNEKVTLEGFGFPEGTSGPTHKDERLIRVWGDHIHISDLELAWSSRYGLEINGSYGRYENITVRDSWNVNIAIGLLATDKVEGNLLRNIESFRSRHDSGIKMGSSSYADATKMVKNNRIENAFLYDNGYQPDGTKVPVVSGDPAGGGNSDAIDGFKSCQDNADKYGVDNLCPGNIIKNSIAWHNADDGFDISFGSGSKMIGNISFDNGPEGARGYKMLRYSKGGVSYIGNVAVENFGPVGGFQALGFELRIDGEGVVVHNTALNQNIGDNDRGLSVSTQNVSTSGNVTVMNNLGAFNAAGDVLVNGTAKSLNNWAEQSDGSPGFERSATNVTLSKSSLTGLTIEQKVKYIQNHFRDLMRLSPDSPLVDAATFDPSVHCATADDDPVSPMNPSADCHHWKGSAPDIGAFEYY